MHDASFLELTCCKVVSNRLPDFGCLEASLLYFHPMVFNIHFTWYFIVDTEFYFYYLYKNQINSVYFPCH